ncbi:saccharopine dehydrogenase C-terminal domain-containing protein [Microbacterium sp. APC 3898]|uniref:Saccharopine dehydrogenase C-terminal domain-containing protein n=1 Tax=Planococcus notacanthi TaxID=3035188 RepID=A0ABT7ZLP5_9BACL|nr:MULTISPECIES: saccharopine dehydrogenase C-terminal domain-containing protein [Terrabacteria group]MDN3427768.1 saccharopine dehydrogenase C-terminal domain-containing protein [Planococcus sp. APC 4016]MDN3499320.1 saccharopine dehydrogenase C-terminal domain-containing protein [Microbacterium sp. APC 3898]
MKIVVLGAGLMGKQAARDLVEEEAVERVFLADRNISQAKLFCEQLGSDKLEVLKLDAADDAALAETINKGDIVINALFYTFNEKVAATALQYGVHVVDLGGHIGGATDAVLDMHEKAQQQRVTLIPDLGVAPGMINILTGYGAGKLDQVSDIRLYVGGIPLHPEPPLEYNHVFSLEGVFDHYTDKSHVIRSGKLLEVESLSEIEHVTFKNFGELEAFHTSGGTSTLTDTFSDVDSLEYKTLRYKGHAKKFKLLVDLGFTDRKKTVEVDGREVNLRAVLKAVLEPITALGDKQDAVVLRVLVSGVKEGEEITYEYNMVTVKDPKTGVTAMARATAYTISVVAQMIGKGIIDKRGAYPPEMIVPGDAYIEEMAKRGVNIEETVHRSAFQS